MYVQFKYAAKNEIRSLDHGYFYHGNVVAKGHFLVARDVKFYKMTFNPDCRSYVVSHQTHLGVIHSDVTKRTYMSHLMRKGTITLFTKMLRNAV